jgi:hypothetical protein
MDPSVPPFAGNFFSFVRSLHSPVPNPMVHPEWKSDLVLSSTIIPGNRAAQDDEIEALKSIYGEEDFVLHGDYSCEVNFPFFSLPSGGSILGNAQALLMKSETMVPVWLVAFL